MRTFRIPMLALAMAIYFLFFNGAPAFAGLAPSIPSTPELAMEGRKVQIETVQRALESQVVGDRLKAYGLSAEEVTAKLDAMSDEQLHMMAQASERVLAGGSGLGIVISVLVIILLVVLIMKLVGKEVVVR